MGFWLIVILSTPEGEFLERNPQKVASMEQCIEMVGEEARKIVNTQTQAQFFCMSDKEYRIERRLDQ